MAIWTNGVRRPPGSDDLFSGGGGSGWNTGLTDAFGRQRVSQSYTVFDSKQLFGDPTLFWDTEVQGTGEINHSTANAATTLSVTTSGDSVIRQTRQRFNYQPGKSQFALFTGVMSTQADIKKRIGLFEGDASSPYLDPENGVYFENDGTGMYVCVAKGGSATRVAQADWNIDKLDGTTGSQITLDPSKAQIFFIDFEWLGVGRVRFGFFVKGTPHYCHEILNANVVTSVYMSTPNLPIRYQLESSSGAGSLVHICCAIQSESGVQPNGVDRAINTSLANTPFTHVDATTANSIYPLLAIRLKSTHLGAFVKPTGVTAFIETQNSFRWALHFNPTYTFGTFNSLADSCIEYIIFDGTPSPISVANSGTVVASGYTSNEVSNLNINLDSALKLGAGIDGTRDVFMLSAASFIAAQDIHGGLSWREIQ